MTCDTARNRLMGLPDPAAVPAALASHLQACPGCQAWHQLLSRVEGAIVALAPPASSGRAKQKLIEQFRGAAPSVPTPASKARKSKPLPVPSATVQPAPERRPSVGERLARLWPASLVAAALLVGVLVWSSFRGKTDGPTMVAAPPDPFLEKMVMAKVKLDTAPDRAGRLAVLDGLATDIRSEAKAISMITPGAEMDSLARMYDRVVTDGLVAHARDLPAPERRAKLDKYIQHLAEAEQEANQLAAAAPPGSDRPLREIAKSAEKGRIALSKMMQG
jgi:hypothetical protein